MLDEDPESYSVKLGMFNRTANDFEQWLTLDKVIIVSPVLLFLRMIPSFLFSILFFHNQEY